MPDKECPFCGLIIDFPGSDHHCGALVLLEELGHDPSDEEMKVIRFLAASEPRVWKTVVGWMKPTGSSKKD